MSFRDHTIYTSRNKDFRPEALVGMHTVAGKEATPSAVVMHWYMDEYNPPIPYHQAEILGTPTMVAAIDEPFPSPFCETAMDPDRFNGKIVTIRGRVKIAFEDFELSTTECKGREIDSIWLEYGKGPKKQPTIWCCGDLTPKDAQIVLIQNKEFRSFHRYLTAQRRTKGCYFGQCYLYSVTATLTGRLDAVPAVTCPVGTSQCPKQRGFGHFGMFTARLVIESVSDVVATALEVSPYEKSK
jgi:hypothetical protein